MPDALPITTPIINPQQVENACSTEHFPDIELSNDQDIDMDWDEESVITPNEDDQAAPSQASAEHAPPPPSSTVELMEGNSTI
ncbi:hypothetical protein N7534_003756 [Penicillium rubens]|nr:hypothetical protein N7534_003756 [Penicillium rubens]